MKKKKRIYFNEHGMGTVDGSQFWEWSELSTVPVSDIHLQDLKLAARFAAKNGYIEKPTILFSDGSKIVGKEAMLSIRKAWQAYKSDLHSSIFLERIEEWMSMFLNKEVFLIAVPINQKIDRSGKF